MEEQKISLKNIHNFIKYIGPKTNASLDDLIIDLTNIITVIENIIWIGDSIILVPS